jgi:predicted methyltransferase
MRSFMLSVALLTASASLAAIAAPVHIEAAVAAPERSDRDRTRDARERPGEFMEFAGIVEGMTIADVFGGGGYWSELLARAVGPEGRVRLVNNDAYMNFAKDALEPRLKDGRLPNVELGVVDTADLGLGSEAFDVILIFMSYHDLYYVDAAQGWPAIDAAQFLHQLHTALRPGGTLLIVDHAAAPDSGNAHAQTLHRIEESWAKRDIEGHGFRLEKTWDGLRNPDDDLGKLVFDPAVRGKTDRFVHLYRKP